jgi:nicotinate-nucleotide adenylyltransferase
MQDFQERINEVYTSIFGRTPLKQRLDDILKEAMELHRSSDLRSLKDEAGDLFTTLVQLMNECDWDCEELVTNNLTKIKKRKNQYLSLGRKIQVAILGGAFDPPSLGHIQVAELILNHSRTFDEVWLMPCYKHIYGKKPVAASHRVNMCEIAACEDGRIKVFDYEIRRRMGGETYHLVKRLLEDKKYNSTYNFSFIIGLDNANTFDQWINYEHLEKLTRFVVVPRSGEKRKRSVNWFFNSPHMFIEPDQPLMNISSTMIRNSLKENEDLITGLDPYVHEYILQNNLYRRK